MSVYRKYVGGETLRGPRTVYSVVAYACSIYINNTYHFIGSVVIRASGTSPSFLDIGTAFSAFAVTHIIVPTLGDNPKYVYRLSGGMSGATNLKDCEVLESLVKKQVADGKLYAAICGSPAVALGSWGVLKGLKVTCYPSFMEQLAASGATAVESRVQLDGKAVTSRGPGTTMEFAVALVEQLCGKEKADEVSGPMVNAFSA
ncbi:hypothetical protein ACLB2K_025872 [Fragaria x ananassa]